MSTTWQQLLQNTAGRWQDGELTAFTDPVTESQQALTGSVMAPLPATAIIEATGADVTAFLQGQVSNDIQGLADGGSCLAAYCNPKGRMLALFRIIRRQDDYLLLLPSALLEPTLKRLRMFVMRSKVTFTDISDRWAALGVSGGQAESLLAQQGLTLPAEPDAGDWQGDAAIIRLRGEQPRALILAQQERMAAIYTALASLTPIGEPAWRLLDIRAGVPEILAGAAEKIIPQMANLDLLNGISFTKGCYPGQEIVARMHYLGNLKRRMFRLVANTTEPLAPGSEVRTTEGSLAGEIVMATPAPDGRTEALAVLQIDRAKAGDLQVDGHAVEVQAVPYLADA